jgi:cob(I)alamin adenosyltransferase
MKRVYTRTGDRGETGLIGGARVSKSHPRIEAYGTVDELNSWIGVVRATLDDLPEAAAAMLRQHLEFIQHRLFALGADLANPTVSGPKSAGLFRAEDVAQVESAIDAFGASLPPLAQFLLPAGNRLVATLHVARTVARRSERAAIALHQVEPLAGHELRYLNRLSDLLFVMARWAATAAGQGETRWRQDPAPPPLPSPPDSKR